MNLFNNETSEIVKDIRELSADELLAVSGGEKTTCTTTSTTTTKGNTTTIRSTTVCTTK
jgi:hypothetical protein